jgi:hypothetical protein
VIGVVVGTISKSGTTEYGGWALVAEPAVHTKANKVFTPKVMCSGDDIPAVGTPVLVTGTVMAKVSESDGKSYANLSMSFCRFEKMGEAAGERQVTEADFADGPATDEDIPF